MAKRAQNSMTQSQRNCRVLAVCVFIDLFAVSLIVPLLPIRYRQLGVSRVAMGLIGSVYSVAQIFGGLAFGVLSDRLADRRTVLLISFAGAALSYALVGLAGSVELLVLSRVVVGLVKQTMTASKAMAAEWSDDASRAQAMGLVSSAATAAWVTGSAATGFINRLHPAAPSCCAVGLYALDAALVLALLPPTKGGGSGGGQGGAVAAQQSKAPAVAAGGSKESDEKKAARPGFLVSARRAFGNREVGRFVCIRLAYGLVARAAMSNQDVWEMDRFGLKMGQLGWLQTVKSLLSVAFQGAVAGPLVRALGERKAFLAALGLAVVGSAFDLQLESVLAYACLAVPTKLVSGLLAALALESLMTQIIPKSELGSALGVTDVLSSGIGVAAPLIGGAIIEYFGLLAKPLVTGVGYLLVLAAALSFLPRGASAPVEATKKLN
mmetsp:Transcript_14280/g.33798  ORF Transcript_14280/g.33798 Transcript_14280/m.33798 type:complete len:437 (-) Transcript_14280:407-1717(-)